MHLQSETVIDRENVPHTTMLYKIGPGPVEEGHYGLELAASMGLPKRFVAHAREAATRLRLIAEERRVNSKTRRTIERRRLLLNLRAALDQARESGLDDAALMDFLERLQGEFVRRMVELEDGEYSSGTQGVRPDVNEHSGSELTSVTATSSMQIRAADTPGARDVDADEELSSERSSLGLPFGRKQKGKGRAF